jgi:hypothetical protein
MEDFSMAGNDRFMDQRWYRISIKIAFLLFCAIFLIQASAPQQPQQPIPPMSLFRASDTCMACHNGLITPSGQDVSFGFDWRSSIMANSARDPYWHAAVRREVIDHPQAQAAIENECAKCHMPMASFEARAGGQQGSVFKHLPVAQRLTATDRLAADGVSCTLCHQIDEKNFGQPSSFTGGYLVSTAAGDRPMFGPFIVDAGLTKIMHSATGFIPTQASHLQKSEMCATCHTLITHAFGAKGEVIGELPEQIPYEEWLQSGYPGAQTCQSCHMPVVQEPVAISSVLGEPRTGISRHVFIGGNFFMLRMLNRYRAELGVEALPAELKASAERTIFFLQNQTAKLSLQEIELVQNMLNATVVIENLAGHKLPTAYPSRRVWLQFTVRDRTGKQIFESGAFLPEGMIRGNDNDLDASKYEPHYQEIHREDQVQIYESMMVDSEGTITTGLLFGVRFVKDNRLLPAGFDKQKSKPDTAVHGDAANDPDFTGGSDRVVYRVNTTGHESPFQIDVKLWYQPIAFRWAQNLRPYEAVETKRFVTYYESMASESAVVIRELSAITR